MGLFGSLEKKFDELKKDVGLGGNKHHHPPPPHGYQQGYPGAQHHYQQQQQQQPYYYPPQQGYGQPHPQGYQPPPYAGYNSPPATSGPPPIPGNKPKVSSSGNAPPHHGGPPQPQQPKSGNPTDYWQPCLHNSRSVGEDFDQKIGNGPDGWGNNELQHYTSSPANSFYTPDYKLVLRALSNPDDPNPETRFTSARLVSHQRLGRPRGSLTAVLTVPSAPGIWPAFWMLPAEPFAWPGDGEVDIAESWNADPTNHSCLHWGHFNGPDHDKHRVMDTPLPGLPQRAIKYEFAWDQDESSGRGRYVWWIDGRAVMRCGIPEGLKRMREWTVLLNVAMGGNVCQGVRPGHGSWDMVVHELRMSGECDGGWRRFEEGWQHAPEGRMM